MDPGLLGDNAGVGELTVELGVEFGSVGHQHEGPRPRHAAQHLLGEPQHREALTRSLGVPEHPEAGVSLSADPMQVLDRGVDAEHLVVARHGLNQAAGSLEIGDEVLNQVEQPVMGARATDGGLQLDHATSEVGIDDPPVAEKAPRRKGGPDLRLGTVGKDHKTIWQKQMGNRVTVVA